VGLNRRERETLAAITRTLVPSGASIPEGADELGLVDDLIAEVNGYPKRARRRIWWLLLATEYLPLVSGHRRRFRKLSPEKRFAVLERNGRHRRSPLRRLIVSLSKQVVYSAYISHPKVEDVVAYRYECLLPRPDVTPAEGERVHH
jgi:hypothetical protein